MTSVKQCILKFFEIILPQRLMNGHKNSYLLPYVHELENLKSL